MNAMISGLRPYLVGVTLSCVLCQPVHGKKVNQTQSRAEPGGRPSQEEKAKQLLTQGSSELDRRELSSAYKTLSAAYSGFPNTEGLYQLCRLAIAEGNAVAARDLCRRYLADPGHAEESTVPHQKELLDALGKTIPPSGEVAVFGSLGALVFLDDRLVGSLPLSRPLLAPVGQHRVALVDSGHRQEWPVKVLADRTVEMRFEPESSAVLVTQLPAVEKRQNRLVHSNTPLPVILERQRAPCQADWADLRRLLKPPSPLQIPRARGAIAGVEAVGAKR